MDKLIKIRIFGSGTCDLCNRSKTELDSMSMEYEFIDALLDKNQDLCDLHSVEKLPHIQLYFADTGKIIREHRGYISPIIFISNIVSKSSKKAIVKNYFNKKCNGCGSKNIKDNEIKPDMDFLN